MMKSFPGLPKTIINELNSFDWLLIMLIQKDPELYAAAYGLQARCDNITNMTCFEVLMDPTTHKETIENMFDNINYTRSIFKEVDFTAGFQTTFSALWRSKLPCFDTISMSALNEGARGILKRCKWKGVDVPCSGIFTTFPTDRGMCCSFNMRAANEIFAGTQYPSLVKQLQAIDYNTSFENSTLPLYYTSRNEPRTQAGISMGLEVVLDAHTDVVESFSIGRDFEGFTGLISESDSFPLTNIKGFEIKPGYNNLVAISAVKIDADDGLRKLNPEIRKCLYSNEVGNLTLFRNYSQSK